LSCQLDSCVDEYVYVKDANVCVWLIEITHIRT
jgi:hypothetical protein